MIEEAKICGKCQLELPLMLFPRNRSKSGGFDSRCKNCSRVAASTWYAANKDRAKSWKIEYYAKNREKLLVQMREYSNLNKEILLKKQREYRAANASRIAEQQRLSQQRYPEKHGARLLTQDAIRTGILSRQCCEKCGAEKTEAHHDDYSKPLQVRWLCHTHHAEHHRLEREDQRRAAGAA